MARRRLSGGLRTLLGARAGTERKSLDSRAISSYRGYAIPGQPYHQDWNTDRAVREGVQANPYIFRAVEVCADNALARRIRLRREDPDDGPIIPPKDLDDSQRRLLHVMNRKTNKWEVAPIWRHRLIAQYLLSSRGVYVEAIRNRRNNLWGLLLLDPDLVEPVPTYVRDERTGRQLVADPLGAFRVTRQAATHMGGEWQEDLPPWDPEQDHTSQPSGVVFIRSPHPTLLARGLSPMEAAGLSADLDRHARLYNRRFLEQDGRPGGILGIKGEASEATERRLQSRFQGGAEHAGRTTVIQADDMFWQDTSGTPRDTQWGDTMDRMRRELSIAFGVPESVLGDASGRCVDMETEALTQRGWLRGDEITTDDTILSMDPADGRLKWSPVHEVYRAHYCGDMYRLRHQHADFLVTPGHNWAVETRTRDRQRGATTPYLLRKVEDLSTHDRIRTIGEPLDDNTAPTYTNAFVELVGWAVTEGHFTPNATSREARPGLVAPYVRIRQNVGANADRIAACAKEAGSAHIVREKDGRVLVSIRGEIAAALHQVAPDKVMATGFLLALTTEQRHLLMRTMLDADGCTNVPNTASWTFAQKNLQATEAFILLATLCGYTTSLRRREFTYRHSGQERPAVDWMAIVRQRKWMTVQRQTRTIEQYDGDVWCPRTDFGTFVARRRGKVLVTGNTFDNADAEYEGFWQHKMWPLLRMLDAQLDVLTPGGYDDDLFLQHDVSDVWVLGRHKRAEQDRALEQYQAGAVTLDYVRVKLEQEPLDIPATRTLHIPPGKIIADDGTPEHDGDQDAVAALPMMGTPMPVDPAAAAQAGAEQGSQLGARTAENNVASWRVMSQADRGAGALAGDEAKQLAVPPPLPGQTLLHAAGSEVEGEQSRAHPARR